ncbi:MAG: S41 family peptidase [Bacteroidota bacterium]
MKYLIPFCCLLLSLNLQAQDLIPAAQLQEDFRILKESLEALHPALYKYDSPEQRAKDFEILKYQLSEDQSRLDAYRHFSLFAAKIKCGHTYGNFWNQSKELRKEFIEAPNKVPFTFRIIEQEIYIYQNLSESPDLKRGDKVISIDGFSAREILDGLLPYVKADGANDGKRYFDLQVFGLDNFEAFDIYYPLAFYPGERIDLIVEDYADQGTKAFDLAMISRKERFNRLKERYGKQIETYDDYWKFEIKDNKVGILTIGTFVTWRMSINWRKFIKDAFAELKAKNIQHLILDIRGNEGGNSAVQEMLYGYLTQQTAQIGPYQQSLKAQKVPDELRPYIGSWSKKMMDVSSRTYQLDNGFYTFKNKGLISGKVQAKGKAYSGQIYVLADASNSSGTYFLLNYIKQNQLATIIGQESGGNLQGITGGQIFYIKLPNSKVEIDLPVIGYYPTSEKANKGIEPDVYVKPNVKDLIKDIDSEMAKALEMIQGI